MTNEVIQQATALAGLITSIAALLTILELRRQRLAQYMPTLVIEDRPVRIYKQSGAAGSMTLMICPEGAEPSERHPPSNVSLELANVGAGPALDVAATWSYDELAAAECVAAVDPKASKGLIVDPDVIHFDGGPLYGWVADRVNRRKLGTLPVTLGGRGPRIRLPLSYLELLCIFLRARKPGDHTVLNLPMPPLELVIDFRDRGGDQRFLRFLVALELRFYSKGGGPIPEFPGWENCGGGEFTVRAA